MGNEEPGNEVTPLPEGAPEASGWSEFMGVVTDVAHWASATFPVAITKNVITAVGRLVTTAADIPAAWMQGKANEMRAVSDVNVQLTKATGKQIAKQLEVTEEFAVAAMNKHASRIIGKQANVQKVVRHAVEQLKLEAPKTVDSAQGAQEPPVTDISEDWLNVFEQEAMNMSSDAMQRHFGRILAGEIRKPASFSIKTIKIMAQLDNRGCVRVHNPVFSVDFLAISITAWDS